MSDDLDKYFDPKLKSVIRATRVSEEDWVKALCTGMEQTAEILSASDADIEEKLSVEEPLIILGHADCDFLPANLPVGLTADVATGGILIVGSVRSGKSNEVTGICDQAGIGGKTTWTFTRKKEHLHRARDQRTLVITPGKFPHNPLRSPKFATNWIAQWCEVFAVNMDLGGVSGSFLARAILDTMERFAFAHPDLKHATLFEVRATFSDIKRKISMKERPKAEYATRSEDRIDGFLASPVGQDCITHDGPDLDDLLFRNVVIDISELSVREAAYVVHFWLTYRLVALMSSHHLVSEVDHIVAIDEGEDILLKSPGVSNISLVSRFFNLFRELGTSLLVSSHSFEALRPLYFLTNNCAALVMLPMSSLADASAMARVMGIELDDYGMIKDLSLGEGIVKMVGVSRPIKVKIDKVNVDRVVTQEELKTFDERTKQFVESYNIHYVPVHERRFVFDDILSTASNSKTAEKIIEEKNQRLDARIKEFVSIVADHPGISLKEVKPLLSFGSSSTTVDAVKKNTVKMKYIKEVKRYFAKDEAGRPMSRLGVTAEGFRFIDKTAEGLGKGDIQQMFLPHVAKHFGMQLSVEVKHETFLNRSDLYVYRNGKLELAVELSITTPLEHVIKQIAAALIDAPAILVIIIGLVEESEGVYVASKQREINKTAKLREVVLQKFGDDPRIIIKTWEDFRQEIK